MSDRLAADIAKGRVDIDTDTHRDKTPRGKHRDPHRQTHRNTGREVHRERRRQTQINRQTQKYRQTQIHTESHIESHRHIDIERNTDTGMDGHTEKHRYTNRKTSTHMETQIHRLTDTPRLPGRQGRGREAGWGVWGLPRTPRDLRENSVHGENNWHSQKDRDLDLRKTRCQFANQPLQFGAA